MSELHIGLISLVVTVIVVVLLVNKYQEIRFKKKTERGFEKPQTDLLDLETAMVRDGLQGDVLAPMNADGTRIDQSKTKVENKKEPTFQPSRSTERALASTLVQEDVTRSIDADIDFVTKIDFEAPIAVLGIPKSTIQRRIHGIGKTEYGVWFNLINKSDVQYVQIKIGLQMVDRTGALSEEDLQTFCAEVEEYAHALTNTSGVAHKISFPQILSQVNNAQELDRFCGEVDAQIAISLHLNHVQAGMALAEYFEDHGLSYEPDDRFHFYDQNGRSGFAVESAHPTRTFSLRDLQMHHVSQMTFLFDVPRVSGQMKVFADMVDFINQMAIDLDGQILDDDGDALTPEGFEQIAEYLEEIYAKMNASSIKPGGELANRLFM